MRIKLFLLLFCTAISLSGQDYCDNLSVEGIYFNEGDNKRIYLALQYSQVNDLQIVSNYTNFMLISDEGDTLSSSNLTYEHTFDYEIDNFENLPLKNGIDCTDYKLLSIHKDRGHNTKNGYVTIYSTETDSILFNTGYTSIEVFSPDGKSLSDNSGPNHFLPIMPSDTFAYEIRFLDQIGSSEIGYIELQNPDCQLTFESIVDDTQEELINIKVFPNPVSNSLLIESPIDLSRIDIYTVTGQLIHTSHKSSIDVSDLSAGIYIVSIHLVNNAVIQRKITKD